MDGFRDILSSCVVRYGLEVADETDDLNLLIERIAAGDALDFRRTWPGHVTTSAIVIDPGMTRVLLVLHRATGRWLQPGGHWEDAESFAESAAREAQEETGVARLELHACHPDPFFPLDIDTHAIPARPAKDEPGHVHFDLRFVFVADPEAALVAQPSEIDAVSWRPFDDLAAICPRVHRRLRAIG
jgi:8-oxo-dGTP pyrophosphatase MutT (NUDIX family)